MVEGYKQSKKPEGTEKFMLKGDKEYMRRIFTSDGKFVYKQANRLDVNVFQSTGREEHKWLVTQKWTISDFKQGKDIFDGITNHKLEELIEDLKL